ncbi:MAG: hypothetical protein IK008_04495 [Bacteroidales bacterium]|nr:hypothetical protein [Bacteroidales bacterium]
MMYLLVILSVFLASGAQMLLKKGASQPHGSFLKEYLNPWVIGGYAILGLTLVLNIYAMSRGIQVKEVGIIESLSYLFVPVLSFLFFKEGFSRRKILSIAIIITGIVIFFL